MSCACEYRVFETGHQEGYVELGCVDDLSHCENEIAAWKLNVLKNNVSSIVYGDYALEGNKKVDMLIMCGAGYKSSTSPKDLKHRG
jgi:hypothetical protein